MPLDEENLCLLSKEELAKIIARLKGEIPTTIPLPDNTYVIPAGDTVVVHPEALGMITIKFHISTFNIVEEKYRTFDYKVTQLGASIKDTVNHVQQNGLVLAIDSNVNGGSLETSIENKNAYDITVKLKRLDYINP